MKRRNHRFRETEIIAYDLETTRIKAGTPRPLYLTAFGDLFSYSGRIRDKKPLEHLGEILRERFLVDDLAGVRFVGWNANHFDVYFIVLALLSFDDLLLRPYLNRKQMLRGLRIFKKLKKPERGVPCKWNEHQNPVRWKFSDGKTRREEINVLSNISWEFLDGMAMVSGAPIKLSKFLKMFAPEFAAKKMTGPNFEKEEFDPDNSGHVAYAFNDSEGLYHGMLKVQTILREHFDATLQPTIGNLGIKLLVANLPEEIVCWRPPKPVETILREQVFRGGFVWCARKYDGPVWKYDLNQAYAAAMRECWLPCGRMYEVGDFRDDALSAIYRVRGTKPGNAVPFYYTGDDGKRRYGFEEIGWTWVTVGEVSQLKRERWNLEIDGGYVWGESFTMKQYVDRLEKLRRSDPDGPQGALGTIVKYIGNASYGKTVEQLGGMEIVISANKVAGYRCLDPESEFGSLLWFKLVEAMPREYHQPQIGAFITAHVRMVVRRAAILGGSAWLYSDTDCCMFTRAVHLAKDPTRYGAWKEEAAGDLHLIIDKKVYMSRKDLSVDDPARGKHAKGMNIARLLESDFEKWYKGEPPAQDQLQRSNLMKVLAGGEMFTIRHKVGMTKERAKKLLAQGETDLDLIALALERPDK